jgi:hypothetical protein
MTKIETSECSTPHEDRSTFYSVTSRQSQSGRLGECLSAVDTESVSGRQMQSWWSAFSWIYYMWGSISNVKFSVIFCVNNNGDE